MSVIPQLTYTFNISLPQIILAIFPKARHTGFKVYLKDKTSKNCQKKKRKKKILKRKRNGESALFYISYIRKAPPLKQSGTGVWKKKKQNRKLQNRPKCTQKLNAQLGGRGVCILYHTGDGRMLFNMRVGKSNCIISTNTFQTKKKEKLGTYRLKETFEPIS